MDLRNDHPDRQFIDFDKRYIVHRRRSWGSRHRTHGPNGKASEIAENGKAFLEAWK